ncbi:hypothetical protein [Chryseobacterium sp. M5A1_1a]
MKYFGFISEHDDYPISKSIHKLIVDGNYTNPHRVNVLKYLQKGIMAIPLMGCIENAKDPLFGTDNYDDENFVAYNAIYTDGVWLWPQYIIEYIKKYPNVKLDPEFVKHVISNKKNIHITEEESLKIEKNFFQKFWK